MKKLIIAAAMAVVAGGAFALDGYDFTATLKTTKGKQSGNQTTTYNLGMDANGVFWYLDTTVVTTGTYNAFNVTNRTTKTINNVPNIPALKTDSKGYLVVQAPADLDLVKKLAAIYNKKSAGKWCQTVKITEQGCYRVAGSVKIDVDLYTTNCCAISGGQVVLTNNLTTAWGPVQFGIWLDMVHRFGALTSAKATKVEVWGGSATVAAHYLQQNVELPTLDEGRWFFGAIAGQGTYASGRVNAVSGNLVGIVDGSVCPNCCTAATGDIAFECDDETASTWLDAAAFGTFRLKYNKKL